MRDKGLVDVIRTRVWELAHLQATPLLVESTVITMVDGGSYSCSLATQRKHQDKG